MRIGTFISDTGGARTDVGELRDAARWAESAGFTTAWVPHLPWGLDAMVALTVAGQREPVLLIAALAPLMLKLAGELADGTILWFADEHAIETHVVPRITAAAAAAGRPAPRVIAPFPVALCDEAEGRERAAQTF